MADPLSFISFEKFKTEVAQRTKKALQQQPATNEDGARDRAYDKHELFDDLYLDLDKQNLFEKRPKSARGVSDRYVPVHENIPDRLKHTPRTSSGDKKTPTSGPVSKRLLKLADTSKGKCVYLYANDGHYDKAGYKLLLPENMELLLDTAAQKLSLPAAARLVFRLPSGDQIRHFYEIEDEDQLVFSCKEPFKSPPPPDLRQKSKSKIPVKQTKATKQRIAAYQAALAVSSPPSISMDTKLMLQDTNRLLRHFRLAYGTQLQKNSAQEVLGPERSLETVRLLCGLGAVSLRNQALTSLKGMTVQSDMVELYLQNNLLTNFEHLPQQPKLKEIRLENNVLHSFRGFQQQPRLEQIWLEGNPIFAHPQYRLMVAILQLNGYLTRIDNVLVERDERLLAQALAPYVTEALRAGWLLDTVRQHEADLDMSVAEFQEYQYSNNLNDSLLPLGRAAANGRANKISLDYSEEGASSQGAGGYAAAMQKGGQESPHLSANVDQDAEMGSPGRMAAQIERLTDALVRASQKSNVKEKLLVETSAKLRAVQETAERTKKELEVKEEALKESEKVLAKRTEQCRQLYDIVGALEQRLAQQPDASLTFPPQGSDRSKYTNAAVQTEEWSSSERAAAVGEELMAERRSRASERAALEAKIQRLELSIAASENSSNHVHLALFSEVRSRLMGELSYSIPDSNVISSIVKGIDRHLGEFGGDE